METKKKLSASVSKPWKPQLLPNDEAGVAPDWASRIANPNEWMYSTKYDGARVGIFANEPVKGRSLKGLPSIHVNRMGEDIALALQLQPSVVIETEFYAPNMSFPEIIHFFKTEDVTSDHTKRKYDKLWEKTKGDVEKGWKFPGREPDFLTQWHDELKFYAFGIVDRLDYTTVFEDRAEILETICDNYTQQMGGIGADMTFVKQNSFDHIDKMYQAFDQEIMNGNEGLVLMHKKSVYKPGRHTLKSNLAFKIKDNLLVFDGEILNVEESTVVREGADKKVNELGRSVTSKLQEDRIPSGMAKGFMTRMEDGKTLTVSLKDYTHEMRKELWEDKEAYVGKWIRFTGMKPTAAHGVPRHAFLMDIRDDK